MAVDVGSAVGYLDLDINGFLANLRSAQSEADKASKNIVTKFGANMQSAGNKLTSAGSTLTKTVTVPIVGVGSAAIKTSSDFESAMSKVSAISGATGTNLDKLNNKAQEMGAKTKFSATESAQAFTYMAMAGWKTEDMLEGIDGIMSLAAADGLDLATTSDIVTDALTAFGLSAKDSGHFADVLAKASSSANTNVSMLGESFQYVAPVAGALGYSAEDTAIALGLMANAGIKGSQAGTALRGSISRLVKPTDDAAAMMDKYGISLTNTDGTMKPLGEVMDNLRERLGSLSEAEQAQAAATLFGQEAMSGMLAIVNASDSDYQSLTSSIYSADGAAQQMADTMLNNLGGQLTLLKSALEGLAIQFGEILMPYIKQFVGWLQSLVQKLQELTPEQKEQIIKWAAIVTAIGPVLTVFGKLTSSIGSIITTFGKIPGAIKAVTDGFTKLTTAGVNVFEGFKLAKAGFTALGAQASPLGAALASVTAPMIAIVAAVALVIAALASLWKNNEEFRNKMIAIWDGIKEKFEAFGQGIADRLNALGFDFENFTQVVKAIWDSFCAVLAPVFEGVFNHISIVIGTVLDVITGILDVFIGLFTGNWDQCWNGIKEIFESIWNGIKDWFINILYTIKGVFDVVLGWFGTSWDACWNGIKSFFEGIWNGIVSFFTGILTSIQTAFTTVFTAISTFFTTIWTNIKSFFEGIWNGIVSFLTSAWETIKNIVTVGIMFIAELFSAAFELITVPFRFIWENCKTTIMTIWNVIKTTITNALTAIQTAITNVWNAVKAFFTTVWTVISTFVMNIWNTIKTNVTNAINAIKTVITNVFNAVQVIITNIWNAIKTTITNVWNSIKMTITNVIDSIKTTLTNVWNAIKTTITTIVNAIKTTITNVWNTIKSTITNVVNGIKSTVSNVFNAVKSTMLSVFNSIKSTAASVWGGIKSAIITPINVAKSTVSSAVNSIKSTISSGFNAAKNTASSVFNSIKNSISSVMNSANSAVSNAINSIRSKFNFRWSLPSLKLPHPRISGRFSLNPPSVPSFSISWYKKAMNNAMILNDATIFGAKGGKLLGGGEAGSEVVSGADTLMKMIKEAVASVFVNMTKTIQTYFDVILLNIRQSNATLVESIAKLVDISDQFAQASEQLGYVTYNGFNKTKEVIERTNNKPEGGGGDTFIFNSPKAIDEIEAAKQMKQAKRDLAEGF